MKKRFYSMLLAATFAAAQASEAPLGVPADALIDQRILDQISAPVKSAKMLSEHLHQLPEHSPLRALSPQLRREFIDSLVFTDRGLASYNYVVLQQIDLADAYRILSLFGVQRSLAIAPDMKATTPEGKMVEALLSPDPIFADYPGYVCSMRATCQRMASSICIGGNC